MSKNATRVSRRAFLKGGAALVSLADSHFHWIGANLQLVSGRGWVALYRDRSRAFELRSKWFAGAVSIWTERAAEQVAFGITGSRHPGLDVSADMTFELWHGTFGVQAAVHHHGLNLLFRGSAEDWLRKDGLRAWLSKPAKLLDAYGATVHVSPGAVLLRANGSLHFSGQTAAKFSRHRIALNAQRSELRLASVDNSSAALTTTLVLHRGSEHWPLNPPRGKWSYEDTASLFQQAAIEAGEDERGGRIHRAIFTSPNRRSPFRVNLHEPLYGSDRRPLHLLMKDAAYTLDLKHGTHVMEAQLARMRTLQMGPLQLRLGRLDSGPALQAGNQGCCIIAQGGLVGNIDNALIVHNGNVRPWNVAVTSDHDPKVLDYHDATLGMIGESPVLTGAINFRILRSDDALDLCFRITNVKLQPTFNMPVPELNPQCSLQIAHFASHASDFALLIADFPPQAMIMKKIDSSTPDESDDCGTPDPNRKYPTRLSAPTRVSMRLLGPDSPPKILDIAMLLEWAQYSLNIAPRARATPEDKYLPNSPIPASATEIVAPAGLSISPDEDHAFFASSTLRSDGNISQVWTARLSRRLPPARSTSAENALTHFPVTNDRRPSLRPLEARTLADAADFVLQPDELPIIVDRLKKSSATARHCVLSPSSGVWLDFGGVWSPLEGVHKNTSAFHEILSGMLEQRAEFTYEGCLVPTGHRIKIIKSGKLQWCRRTDIDYKLVLGVGKVQVPVLVAEFIERFKIVYREPKLISYEWMRKVSGFAPKVQSPFVSAELLGDGTSYLDTTQAGKFTDDCIQVGPSKSDYWAWTQPKGTTQIVPYAFPVQLVDRANVKHVTTMQMLVACFAQSYQQGYSGPMLAAYMNPGLPADANTRSYQMPTPTVDLLQQRVAYARPAKMGNTSYPTRTMYLNSVAVPDLTIAQEAQTNPWFPQMNSTDLILEQVSAFTDPTASVNTFQTFEFATVYKNEPFDDWTLPPVNNRAEVVLSLKADPVSGKHTSVPLTFNGALGGGLAMPSTNVIALARKTGTIFSSVTGEVHDLEGQLTTIGQDGMRVAGMFEKMAGAASLLGAVQLSEVLEEVSDGIAQAAQLPLLAVQQLHTLESETISTLQTELQSLFDYVQTAQQFYDNLRTQIPQLQSQLKQATLIAAQLTRVMATEQRPKDVDELSKQAVDSGLADMTRRLVARMAMSTVQRIEKAAKWPPVDESESSILPTLYQARDYALNQLLADPAQQFAQDLDAALQTGEDDLNQLLDNATMAAGQAVGYLSSCVLYQFVQAANGLATAIQNADVTTVATAFETVADILAAIPSLDQSATSLQSQITNSIKQTTDACNHGVLLARAQTLSNVFTAQNSPLSAPVQKALQDALADGGTLLTIYDPVLQKFTDLVTQVNTFATQMITDEEQLRLKFLQLEDQLRAKGEATVQEAINNVRQLFTIPKHVNVSYSYTSPLKNAGPFLADLNGNRSQFTLNAGVLVNLDGTSPTTTFTIEASVTNFRLNLLPSFQFVIIGFDKASFTSVNGAAPTVHCPFDANNVQLVGPLDFISDLTEALGLPPELVVQLTGLTLTVGLNLMLPDIPSGAFDIVGLSVYTAVKLSFLGDPLRIIFGFATPNQHFIMTYLFLGGGGFINLEFCPTHDTTGMVVTGALEAGAMAALDFGCADGEVYIFAGFYMSIRPNDVLLSGYYRAGGELDVLGLISASVEFIMSLSYENRGGTAWLSGDCEVDVDVNVLFFSTSVPLHMHHDFCGKSGN